MKKLIINEEIPQEIIDQSFTFGMLDDTLDPQVHKVLTALFIKEAFKALHGRMLTPERMAQLYPIFREINKETEAIDAGERR